MVKYIKHMINISIDTIYINKHYTKYTNIIKKHKMDNYHIF